MKYVRFKINNEIKYGILENNGSLLLPSMVIELEENYFSKSTNNIYQLSQVKLVAPCNPSKIVAVGLNYVDHAKELKMAVPNEPVIFIKPSTSVIGPEESIIYPSMCTQLDYEAELAVVIKKKAKNIPVSEVKNYILGYICFNDITARDLQRKDGQWTRAKSFDTFSSIGPWIEEGLDANNSKIELRLNGEIKQSSSTKNFIFKVEELVSFVSQVMTLLPEDIVTTGTPSGVGPMQVGDTVEVVIEGIGILRNKVEKI